MNALLKHVEDLSKNLTDLNRSIDEHIKEQVEEKIDLETLFLQFLRTLTSLVPKVDESCDCKSIIKQGKRYIIGSFPLNQLANQVTDEFNISDVNLKIELVNVEYNSSKLFLFQDKEYLTYIYSIINNSGLDIKLYDQLMELSNLNNKQKISGLKKQINYIGSLIMDLSVHLESHSKGCH